MFRLVCLFLLLVPCLALSQTRACRVNYRIGEIDSRYKISRAEARGLVSKAVERWHSAISCVLFVEDQEAELKVNFVYGELQEQVSQRKLLNSRANQVSQDRLDMNSAIEGFNRFSKESEKASKSLNEEVKTYHELLETYNSGENSSKELRDWLRKERERLLKRQAELKADSQFLGEHRLNIESNRSIVGERTEQLEADLDLHRKRYHSDEPFEKAGVYVRDQRGTRINIYLMEDRRY